jgi:hypothetical protein
MKYGRLIDGRSKYNIKYIIKMFEEKTLSVPGISRKSDNNDLQLRFSTKNARKVCVATWRRGVLRRMYGDFILLYTYYGNGTEKIKAEKLRYK